jgi:hypothetical protein
VRVEFFERLNEFAGQRGVECIELLGPIQCYFANKVIPDVYNKVFIGHDLLLF